MRASGVGRMSRLLLSASDSGGRVDCDHSEEEPCFAVKSATMLALLAKEGC